MELLEKLKDVKIAVIGDLMIDRYLSGKVDRVSPEAPIPVVSKSSLKDVLGGAANTSHNILQFGADCITIGVVGDDSDAEVMSQLLNSHSGSKSYIFKDGNRPTTVKTRVLGNGQQIVRIDEESNDSISVDTEQKIINVLNQIEDEVDGIIVSDYAKGVLTGEIVAELNSIAARGKKIFVDPHPRNKCAWQKVFLMKPNLKELCEISDIDLSEQQLAQPLHSERLKKAVSLLIQNYELKNALITLGEHGMVLFDHNMKGSWQGSQTHEVFDVSGAGDTVIAYFAMAICAGLSMQQSMKICNHAAGKVVSKLGTSVVENDDFLEFE